MKKIKILLMKVKSKNMCSQMEFRKNDFEKKLLSKFFGLRLQIAISQNSDVKNIFILHK